jgi:chromosome partitioning protein
VKWPQVFFDSCRYRTVCFVDTIHLPSSVIKGVLRTSIPYLSIIEYMGVHRAPVGLFAPKSQAAVLFEQLWMEIMLRAKLNNR